MLPIVILFSRSLFIVAEKGLESEIMDSVCASSHCIPTDLMGKTVLSRRSPFKVIVLVYFRLYR